VKVLVVGSGAREHAISWHLRRSGATVVVAPGNAGTSALNAAVQALDIDGLIDLARSERVDLTVVGPEAPLAAGIVDRLTRENLKAFGPTQAAARLEWSKAWTKDFLQRHAIPTATADVVASAAEARQAIARRGLPAVLKADGLASGKGVFVVGTRAEVDEALASLFGQLRETTVLVEQCLEGPELSVLAFTDGHTLEVMPPARDYKRLLDGDRGPNTGGMGGYTRPADATDELLRDIEAQVLRPTMEGMQREGQPYRGVLYAGLMLTRNGPRVLEFNCRFGDPECQLILPLLESNLAEVCMAVAEGELNRVRPNWRDGRTYGVVLAAGGYPEAPRAGDAITGLDLVPTEVMAFHAGTHIGEQGDLVTSGGRVLTLVGFDREEVYRAADIVRFGGKHYRNDVGLEVAAAAGATR
jgi:phosphoribosylamine---glycine ligase